MIDKLHVFTISTGIYNEYLKFQLKTIKNLFPSVSKTYNLISDVDLNKNFPIIIDDEIINYEYYHICNLPYPLITLNKFINIVDMCRLCNYSDYENILFVDADTFFIKSDNELWENLSKKLENNKNAVYLSLSPWSLNNNPNIFCAENGGNSYSSTFIDWNNFDPTLYCQASFLLTNVKTLKKFVKDIENYLSKDLNNSTTRFIPNMAEQSIINKIIQEKSKERDYDIILDRFIYNYYLQFKNIDDIVYSPESVNDCVNNCPEIDYNNIIDNFEEYRNVISKSCFCFQKFNTNLKYKKRNSIKFEINE